MEKLAFMFPGLGSQYPGMGRAFYENYRVVKETFAEAADTLGMDLASVCFNPRAEKELAGAETGRLAMLTVSVATYRLFIKQIGLRPHFLLGHSLGSYSALCCSGAVPFADILHILRQRGIIVNRVSAGADGIMAWVVNLDSRITERLLRESSPQGAELYISAYDSPAQVSISGATARVMAMVEKVENAGGLLYPLKHSGPFHCPMMRDTKEPFRQVLERYPFRQPDAPVISNNDGRPYDMENGLINHLTDHLVMPVQWRESIRYLVEQGVKRTIEMGPNKVLTHLIKSNNAPIATYTMERQKDLDFLQKTFLEEQR
jgi:[acyl-carrier-protein] S-malonyltransferase